MFYWKYVHFNSDLATGVAVWLNDVRLISHSQIAEVWIEDVYRQVSNIKHTLIGNKIVDHSDVFGASSVGAAPTTSSFST